MLKKYFIFSLILGFLVGSTAIYIAIDHNPQMIFYDCTTDKVDYKQLALIFFAWCSIVCIAFTVVLFFALIFIRMIKKKK